ncbi:pyridoxamine 5'-phosphate oxidase family protein [Actinomadura logoneensis]|uniref:pyridoxamine 5'-phosphate oxidase family protein n=1 Tax=Actinomadura logoneensis TaxID=2293572 RepID=UPI00131475F9|nr:pyridoxamine 5'-phosphate oxidase family protein [Actinomadura logoneensis]
MDEGRDVLGRAECLELMRSVRLGRVVFTWRALPAVWPTAFVLDGRSVVFRVAAGSPVEAALRDETVVAFQTDAIEPGGERGWSVTTVGRVRAVRDPAETARLDALFPPRSPDAASERYLRLDCDRLTGTRFSASPRATATPAPLAP